ncbi:MAG: DUF4249 domain-containing protein [Bacteroidota bacterium]
MKYIPFLSLFVLLLSCETIITDELSILETPPLLVVEGGVERYAQDSNVLQQVRLTTTTNFLSDEPNPIVSNAQVSIVTDATQYVLTYLGNGVYGTRDLIPQIGQLYTLEIIWNDALYTAADRLNEVPVIDRVYTEFEEESLFTDEGYFLKLDSRDPVGVANFYHYRVYRNNQFVTVPDPGNSRVLVLSDEFFDGQLRTEVEPNEEVVFTVGDMAMVDQMGISENYFDFLFQVYEQTGQGGGSSFAGNPPPASIRGNVISRSEGANRALGFFYAADVARASILVEE